MINMYIKGTESKRTRGRINPEGKELLKDGFAEGRTISELAKMFNLPCSTVSSIVKDKKTEPKYKKRLKVQTNTGKYSLVLKELYQKRECYLSKINKLDEAIKAIKGL